MVDWEKVTVKDAVVGSTAIDPVLKTGSRGMLGNVDEAVMLGLGGGWGCSWRMKSTMMGMSSGRSKTAHGSTSNDDFLGVLFFLFSFWGRQEMGTTMRI